MRARKPRTSKTSSSYAPKAGAAGRRDSRRIDQRIHDLGDWRLETLERMRQLILEADPEMIEERKRKKPSNSMAGVPVWSHAGIVCTGERNTRRAIDIHEGELVDAGAFKVLVKAAVAQNGPPAKKR